jgi:DNA-binding transcriptional regulator YiaG
MLTAEQKNHPNYRTHVIPWATQYRSPMPALQVAIIRDELQMTQTDFARLLGVTQTTVSRWESGKSLPQGIHARVLWLLFNSDTLSALAQPPTFRQMFERLTEVDRA